MNLEYNTQRGKLIISEYGRHIQKLVEYALTKENKDERQKITNGIIEMMGELNPHLRDIDDFKHKLWDHIFIISDFKLDVDSPYPKPEVEELIKKPEPLKYPNKKIRFNHYGSIIEDMIQEAINFKDEDIKKKLTLSIANQMKKSYVNWNRDSVKDSLIFKQLDILSGGKLSLDENTQLTEVSVVNKSNTQRRKKHKNNRNQYRN